MNGVMLISCPGFSDTAKVFIPAIGYNLDFSMSQEIPERLMEVIKEYNIHKVILQGFVSVIKPIEEHIKTIIPKVEIEIGE